MMPVAQRNSPSIVLRSTHIVLIEVLAANDGPWGESRPGFESRTVELSVRITETLRGKLDPPPTTPVSISITQYKYAGMLMMQPLPGPWPGGELSPGMLLAAFAETAESSIERVLASPACTLVLFAEPVATGLRIASQAEAGNLSLENTLALADSASLRLDPIFAEFLWAKYGDDAMASVSQLNLLASFAEKKELTVGTRQALLQGAYDLIGLHSDSTPKAARRLALAMFRVLLMPDAADLHENLIDTFLPNLLGITSGLHAEPASAVFMGEDALRAASKEFLQRQGALAGAKSLLHWLGQK